MRLASSQSSTITINCLRLAKLYFLRFDHLAQAPLGIFDERSVDALPHLLHGRQQGFCLAHAIEFKVDHSKVWVVDRPRDPVTAYARLLPEFRKTIKRRFPLVKMQDGMLQM